MLLAASRCCVGNTCAYRLLTTPEHFWYLNNGITVIANTIKKKLVGGADNKAGVFDCEGVSVVNGAQTVGCIGRAAETHPEQVAKARVLVKLVSLENAPPGFGLTVTRAANTQNRIERRDFVALDPEQQRLRRDFAFEKLEYVYKSGDAIPAPANGCDLAEATVALACARDDVSFAVQAKREIGKLWEDVTKSPYKTLFNSSVSAAFVWRAVEITRAVEEALKGERARYDGKQYLVAVHGNRFLLHRVFVKLAADGVFSHSNADGDVAALRAAATSAVAEILGRLVVIHEKLFPSAYAANTFKNATRCRVLATWLNTPEVDGAAIAASVE